MRDCDSLLFFCLCLRAADLVLLLLQRGGERERERGEGMQREREREELSLVAWLGALTSDLNGWPGAGRTVVIRT